MNYFIAWVLDKKQRIFLTLMLLLISLVIGCSRPVLTGKDYSEIDVSGDPVQIQYEKDDSLIIKIRNGEYTLYPIAWYTLSGMVVSKKYYSYGWEGQVAPADLAIVWGKLTESECDKFISYSQSNRFYYYRYEEGCPVSGSYIISHSSNNHIIPANENILMAIKSIKKKEKIQLDGYLVNFKGTDKEVKFWRNTSLSRSDSLAGSCEIIYVVKVRIGDRVYE